MAKKMTLAWQKAKKVLASGVNSPVRAFKAVGGDPIFMRAGKGATIEDENGKQYIDYCLSWGALLMGHAYPKTVAAVQKQAAKGTSFGTATTLETDLAAEIQKSFPSMQRMRFTSSGTEAAMSAIRLARGITGKNRILKFEGCYHGHADSLLVKAGSGLATFGAPDSAGVPRELAALTSVLPYNDTEAVKQFLSRTKDLACVIVEPVAANMGVVPANQNFLDALKIGARQCGAMLIFDEVISGFRLRLGGAQHFYGMEPDLTVLGKIIGGGLPVGAFGGATHFMDSLSPRGTVYQAGTLSGNPLSMAAGMSVLSGVSKTLYSSLDRRSGIFVRELETVLNRRGHQALVQSLGSMFTVFFGVRKAENFSDANTLDRAKFRRFFHHMANGGVYIPPSGFEAWFLSAAHTEGELKKTLEVAREF